MSKPLFGAMAMFYAVTSGAGGGGSSLTPPAAIIGAVPQLNFSDVANTGGYLQNSAAAGTILTDGAYYDGAAWIPKDTGAVMLQMNGALAGFVMYVNTSLTPGTPFTPTMVYQYLGAGSNVDFAPPVGATGGVVVSGGSLPTTGDSLSITKTNIAAKNWTAGTYNALAFQSGGLTIQLSSGAGAIDSSFALGAFGSITHSHVAQAAAAESFYLATVADDATAKFQIKNFSTTNGIFVPSILTIGSGTGISRLNTVTITTDSGTSACRHTNFDVGGSNVTVRPLETWASVGAVLLQLLPLGTGNNACFQFASGSAIPSVTTRSLGTRVVYVNGISGTTVDYATGVESGFLWNSVSQAVNTNGFRWYGATTALLDLLGDGTLNLKTGGLRVAGATVTSVGPAIEVLHNGTAGSINSYDRSAATWKTLGVQALSMTFTCNTVLGLTLSSTAVTAALPLGVPSFTVAGVPSAATAGQIVYVSNESGGAVLAFSDGTNWRRVTDRAIIS